MMRPRIATYRLQLRQGMTFAKAAGIVPYLRQLGVSHLYLSPIFTARPGSTHGYDAADPTEIDPSLGGEAGFAALVEAVNAAGLGLLLDFVPNHLGIGAENPLWQDLLKNGPDGFGGRVFDVDWQALAGGTPGKVLLPILGDPLVDVIGRGELVVEPGPPAYLSYFDHRLPLAGDDASGSLDEILARQHWRLAWWRCGTEMLNWRRFFDITELAGIRVEDDAVFQHVHKRLMRMVEDGQIDGIRLDHVDGLADPAGYLRRLHANCRSTGRDEPWLLVEKIVGPGEELPDDWCTAGTTGYEVLNQLTRLFVNPDGLVQFDATFARFGGDPAGFAGIVGASKRAVLETGLRAELERLIQCLTREPDIDVPPSRLREALIRTIAAFPFYRTYGSEHRSRLESAFAASGDAEASAALRRSLVPDSPLLTAFEQLSGPVMAKSLEDTAFYRWHRLTALNEVGGEPDHPWQPLADFHAAMQTRADKWPYALTTTATHDTKRGEDTRLRIACLSQMADAWGRAAGQWWQRAHALNGDTVSKPVAYFLFQTFVGVWPDTADELAGVTERLKAYAIKAMREAKQDTSWLDPDEAFETTLTGFVERCLSDRELTEAITTFMGGLRPHAEQASLAMTMLKLTLPGIPDIYQGTELTDLSLVDPDNRRPVDFDRLAGFEPDAAKQQLIRQLLAIRGRDPELFARGSYQPLVAEPGTIAFSRRLGGSSATVEVALRVDAKMTVSVPHAAEPQDRHRFPCGQIFYLADRE